MKIKRTFNDLDLDKRYLDHDLEQHSRDFSRRSDILNGMLIPAALGKTANTSAKNMFTHTGSIIVKKKGNLEQAMEDAINIGAEDVEEFMENDMEYFQFKCDPKLLNKIKGLLKDREYYVLLAEEDYVPQTVIELNESDLEAVSHIHERVLSLEDVNKIHDNLA